MAHRVTQPLPPVASLSHGSRPILAIDTAPHPNANRHPSIPVPRDMLGGEIHSPSIPRNVPDPLSTPIPVRGVAPSKYLIAESHLDGLKPIVVGSAKQRTKKITVACNFCRCKYSFVSYGFLRSTVF